VRPGRPSAVPAPRRSGSESRPRASADAVTALTVFLVLLFAIPSRLIFAPLGGAGSPAQLLGVAALLWWAATRLARGSRSSTRQPIRWAMGAFVVANLLSYVAATIRPIDDVELRAADRGLLSLLSWLGIVLLACDGIPSRARLDVLLRRLVIAGGCIAILGLAQFFTHQAFVNYIQIPGLSQNTDLGIVLNRDGFSRPAGTALHPIEYGIVITMMLPLALYYALMDKHRPPLRRWWAVIPLAMAVPVSISRSAIVCTAVVLAVMLPALSRTIRRRAYTAIVVLLSAAFVAVPGIIGTLFGLFTGIGGDSSAQSRTGSYTLAWEFISRAPVFGRGFQTFLPQYRILDNQYLLSTIETGIVGVAALLALFATGFVTARKVRKLARDEPTRLLAQAIAASILAGAASFALFDALSFPQVANLVMLMVGIAGAAYRLQVDGDTAVPRHAARHRQRPQPGVVSTASDGPSSRARPAGGTAASAW
jgi:polysaccharide biosynthesis protein PslJ